ncbi:splicing factor, Prp19-binding domain-containing protein [Gloeopeniophorella convolvens]|nr:splicing factor, Prp19-binding domain-containing protein [Gloeopeniophorella convolvens]
MATVARKQAPRPARPAGRYWKGKAPKGAAEAPSSDEESEEEEAQLPQEEGDEDLAGEQEFLRADNDEDDEDEEGLKAQKTAKMSLALKDVNISKEGRVIVAGKEEVGRTEMEGQSEESEEESDAKAAGEDESEDESSEEESESEEEKPKLQFRPVFVPKRSRVTVAEKDALAEDSEEALKRKELEAEERKKQSHDLVAESIRRELLEKEKEEEVIDVDDTDGADPAAEFDAWRLRELARIKRDQEAEIAREQEREEIERRRALPEEQRLKEDLEHANKLREEKPKGKQVFLQKYWHKGAFHQDEDVLKRHDFTEATESTVDVSMLPKVMQVKNFGKRGRTKYTHLVDQDTTAGNGGFGGAGPVKAGGKGTDSGGCFLCGGPHLKKGALHITRCAALSDQGGQIVPKTLALYREDLGLAPTRRQQAFAGSTGRSRGDRDRDGRYDSRGAERDRRDYNSGDRTRDDRSRRSRSRSPRRDGRAPPRRVVRVAIVGSGLAGLTAAYLLHNAHQRPDARYDDGPVDFEVHIFEKAESLGMDSHSVSLTLPGEAGEWRVDVPMRSFQGGYYPQLIALYTRLGVPFRRADFSYSFSVLDTLPTPPPVPTPAHAHADTRDVKKPTLALRPTLIYDGASGRSGISVPTALAEASSPRRGSAGARARADVGRVGRAHGAAWPLARAAGLDARWRAFVQDVCAPLFSAVCTASGDDVAAHPAEEFLDFIWRTFLTHHYVVSHGVRDVVARLARGIPASQIHVGVATTALLPDPAVPGRVSVVCGAHVIFATQANHAAPLVDAYARALGGLKAARAAESAARLGACLAQFKYRSTVVVNHTDDSFLPVDQRDRRDLNLVTLTPSASQNEKISEAEPSKMVVPPTYAMTTHMLPRSAGRAPGAAICRRQTRVLSVARLERALLTRAARRPFDTENVGALQGTAWRELGDGAAGLWVVGSYAHRGIPLLEGCVAGAREIVERGSSEARA